jgi:chromosome segregation ATPase
LRQRRAWWLGPLEPPYPSDLTADDLDRAVESTRARMRKMDEEAAASAARISGLESQLAQERSDLAAVWRRMETYLEERVRAREEGKTARRVR